MGESQWWLYDLVVLSIAVLCIWNGVSGGIYRAVAGLAASIASCLLASILAAPAAEMAYDVFLQDRCQSIIAENLEQFDVTEDVRSYLNRNGVNLPYSDEEIAQMIRDAGEDDALANQAAGMLGMDAQQLKEQLGAAIQSAVGAHEGLLPEWAEKTITEAKSDTILDAASDTAAALFSNDYREAAAGLEESYVKPAVTSVLTVFAFAVSAFLIALLLRVILLVLPDGRNSVINKLLGGALGLVKTGIYLYLIVLLVSGIVSMQNGAYPFFSEGTINRTCIFRLLYDAFV